MSFQIFLGAEQQARLEKMRLDFLVWKNKSSKQMEGHMRSFSLPRTCPASQSLPITPTPPAPPSVVDMCRSVHQQPPSSQMHRPPHIRCSFHRLVAKHRIKQLLWFPCQPRVAHPSHTSRNRQTWASRCAVNHHAAESFSLSSLPLSLATPHAIVTASQPSRHTLRNKRKKRRVFGWFRKRKRKKEEVGQKRNCIPCC